MQSTKPLPELVSEIFTLLEPLDADDRSRVVQSALALLGDGAQALGVGAPATDVADTERSFGPKATRWLEQNQVSFSDLEETFLLDGAAVEVIASDVPGSGKKQKTHNCYLLEGVARFLATDEPRFADADAVALCKSMGCYDNANHAKSRRELGNGVAGSKGAGFTLPAPGLRAAASLIKAMSASI